MKMTIGWKEVPNLSRKCLGALALYVCMGLTSVSPRISAAPLNASRNSSNNASVSQNHELWWFDGEAPKVINDNYQITATLTLNNAPSGTYSWSVIQGSSKVQIGNVSTNTKSAFISSTDMSAPATKVTKDIIIQVSKGGKVVTKFKTVIYAPYWAHHLSTTTGPDVNYAYLSLVTYQFRDQFARNLPEAVPLNEKFTSASVSDYTGEDWRGGLGVTTEGGAAGSAGGQMTDYIGGEDSARTPSPVSPTTAAGARTKVQHWTGVWVVGSDNPGDGLQVRSAHWGGTTYCIWQKYRGYAHHE